MREIKFRGVADKEGGGIELVYGDLNTNCNQDCLYKDTHPDRISWTTGTGGRANKPIRKGTAMQFTGLKDKNGVEIYEGDILSHTVYRNWKSKDVVSYDDDTASFVLLHKGVKQKIKDILEYYDEIEIIGNIYENPELLDKPPLEEFK